MKKLSLSVSISLRHGLNLWVGKIPWRRAWQPTPVFLPGESHGQRSLTGYSPWYFKESDTTEQLNAHASTKKKHVLLLSNHFLALCYPKYLQNVCARDIAENQRILVSLTFFTLWSLLVKVDRAFSGVRGRILFSLSGSEVWAFQHLISNFGDIFFKLCISLELEMREKNKNTVHQTPGFYIHDWKPSTFILEIIHSFFCSKKYVLVNKLQMKSGHLKLLLCYIISVLSVCVYYKYNSPLEYLY